MKRFVLLLLVLTGMFTGSLSISAQKGVNLNVGIIDEDESGNNLPRSPIHVPPASIDDHTFYINESHPDYVLQLVDTDNEENIIYEVLMPAGVNNVILPSSLDGEYVIQLLWGNWRLWGYIELE